MRRRAAQATAQATVPQGSVSTTPRSSTRMATCSGPLSTTNSTLTPLGKTPAATRPRSRLGYLARLPHDPDARLTRITAVHFTADFKIRSQIRDLDAQGYGDFPVGIAKTLFSFSTDPRGTA